MTVVSNSVFNVVINASATSGCRCFIAQISGVMPSRLRTLTFALHTDTRVSAASGRPKRQASNSGVSPRESNSSGLRRLRAAKITETANRSSRVAMARCTGVENVVADATLTFACHSPISRRATEPCAAWQA